ncbi:MAG: hypothetical protein GX228_03475 [Firmicutes bacterium]|nr:hypothetical protein [Bacillota bacterium]NLL87982.1 hypothetical protein [Bacillota bacterium]HKM17948.1 hypothetical protein [Limnochordia bacterium]
MLIKPLRQRLAGGFCFLCLVLGLSMTWQWPAAAQTLLVNFTVEPYIRGSQTENTSI